MANDHMQELIKEINYLANKKKTVGLNEEELARQQVLRKEYIQIFRSGVKQQLESVKVVDANGNVLNLKKSRKINWKP